LPVPRNQNNEHTIPSRYFNSLSGSFDVLMIGGGATGLGLALDSVTRGFHTALVEAGDFAQATSSRSTKLVHGGVRYLATGQIYPRCEEHRRADPDGQRPDRTCGTAAM